MKITILAQTAEAIKDSLDSLIPGNLIMAYKTVDELRDHTLNSTHKTDIILIEDYGVCQDQAKLSDNFMKLTDIFDYRFFKTKRVIFLNKPNDTSWLSYYQYLQEELEDRDIEVKISIKLHTITDIKAMILELNRVYEKIDVNDTVVIQKARREQLENEKLLPEEDKDVGQAVELPQFNKERAKAPFKGNTQELNISSEHKYVKELIVEEDFTVEKHEEQKDKFIMVTGVENSGVTTSSFILSESATDLGKVLLIDLDIHNMGLSYLSDKIYSKLDNVHSFSLEDVYTKSFDSVVLQSMNNSKLHILTITLKLIQKVEDIEFTLINYIEKIKERYTYIIFDAPLRVTKYYPVLLGSYIDRIIITNIPYLNKTVSALKQIALSTVVHLRAYRQKKVSAFSVGLLDKNGLKSVSKNVCRKYSKALLGMDIPFSGIFVLQKQSYHHPTFFRELIGMDAQEEEVEVNQKTKESTEKLFNETQTEINTILGKPKRKKKAEQIDASEVFHRYRKKR